jgi:hypothetical protein
MQQTITILLKNMPSNQSRTDKKERAARHSMTVYFRSPETKRFLKELGKSENRSASNWLHTHFLEEIERIIEARARENDLKKKTSQELRQVQKEQPAGASGAGRSAAS